MRTARITRKTNETDILVEVNLDGTGRYEVSTGIGFLDHMIEQFSRHSLIDITCKIDGDLHVDQHHTTEDSALAIGQALTQALGDKAGIGRYGMAYSPMDEVLARFLDEGIDPEQFERIKAQIRAAEIYALDDVGDLADRYGRALTSGLTVDDVAAWPEVLQAVTPEDVMAAAREVLDNRRSVTGWLVADQAEGAQ